MSAEGIRRVVLDVVDGPLDNRGPGRCYDDLEFGPVVVVRGQQEPGQDAVHQRRHQQRMCAQRLRLADLLGQGPDEAPPMPAAPGAKVQGQVERDRPRDLPLQQRRQLLLQRFPIDLDGEHRTLRLPPAHDGRAIGATAARDGEAVIRWSPDAVSSNPSSGTFTW
jgi:hypothetical protein